MALSNIRREPRREITESLIGILVVVGGVGLDYVLADLMTDKTQDLALAMLAIPLITVASVVVVWGLLLFTHFMGEEICNTLERRGIHLRPKVRVRK